MVQLTRRGYDWTEHYPAVASAAGKLRARSFTIDGEGVATALMASPCSMRPTGDAGSRTPCCPTRWSWRSEHSARYLLYRCGPESSHLTLPVCTPEKPRCKPGTFPLPC